ncbi:hypothetical protein [Planktothrix agardhii]|uniref:hypothetical protein n=1 Tax=Planktothrix agardhii TaxID=1160 RepID=UPI0028757D59|nr:hypothetical protein [Planktothrix agardhii]MDS1348514.1 hypothetical protein [Planktothrix agardhii NRERC-751]
MVFSNITIKKSNKDSKEKPTETELQEILDLLNEEDFETREDMPIEHSYNDPPDIEWSDECHETAKKYARDNDYLTQVSGYLISSIEENANKVELKAHSVVQDTNTETLLEVMPGIYSLEKYNFIEHESGIRGHDLEAVA